MVTTHFHNVKTILDASLNSCDLEKMTDLLLWAEMDDIYQGTFNAEQLAQDLLYVLVSYRAGMTPESKKNLTYRLTQEAVDEEIQEMFWTEDED